MITANTIGQLFGHLIVITATLLSGYAAAAFVTSELNPLEWSPAARLVFLGTPFVIYPWIVRDAK